MQNILIALAILSSSPLAVHAEENPPTVPSATPVAKSRPMDEMHGDCSQYSLNLEKEMALWSALPFEVKAGISTDSSGPIELGRKTQVQLDKENKVKLAIAPDKPSKRPDRQHAGLLRFKVSTDGSYRIAAGSRLWIEVVDAKSRERIPETTFEMQTKCRQIAKVIVYDLKASGNYWLQITGSDTRKAEILVQSAIN